MISPGDIIREIEERHQPDSEAARLRNPEDRLNTEDAISREVIAAMHAAQNIEWKQGSDFHDAAGRIISRREDDLKRNQYLRDMKARSDSSPAMEAKAALVRRAVEDDKIGVVRLACLLCYAAESLDDVSAQASQVWNEAGESLLETLAEAETAGEVDWGMSEAIQLPIDTSYWGLYITTMFAEGDGEDDLELDYAGDARAAAIQQASVTSLIFESPEAAIRKVMEAFEITEEEAASLLDTSDLK